MVVFRNNTKWETVGFYINSVVDIHKYLDGYFKHRNVEILEISTTAMGAPKNDFYMVAYYVDI